MYMNSIAEYFYNLVFSCLLHVFFSFSLLCKKAYYLEEKYHSFNMVVSYSTTTIIVHNIIVITVGIPILHEFFVLSAALFRRNVVRLIAFSSEAFRLCLAPTQRYYYYYVLLLPLFPLILSCYCCCGCGHCFSQSVQFTLTLTLTHIVTTTIGERGVWH